MADEKDPWAAWTPVAEPAMAASHDQPLAGDTKGGLTMAALSKLTPAAAWELMRFGTSPTAAKTGGAIANAATTLAAAGHGLMTGNPSQVVAAPMEGWAAGKGGYWGTKALQGVARPVAVALEKAASVAEAVAKLGGVQGALDLAQMAEPGRKDIGFLGIGPSVKADAITPAQQAEMYAKAVTQLMADGTTSPNKAAAIIAQGNPKKFGDVMTAYMQSRQVK